LVDRSFSPTQFVLRLILVFFAGDVVAEEPKRIPLFDPLPIHQKPIDYWSAESQDPIARLGRRITHEGLNLNFSERFGYLPALLQELEIPLSSQLLRFQSGGLSGLSISSKQPLAVYFDDAVIVRWFPSSDHLEIAAQDSQKGTLFYRLNNRRDIPVRFQREQICLNCHNQEGWLHSGIAAPGHIVRSDLNQREFRQFPLGTQRTHAIPLEFRWSGQYVTGARSTQNHRGNLIWEKGRDEPRKVANMHEEFDVDRYPVPTSDTVAHLVFDHLMFGHNLLSRLSYEHQSNVRSKIETMVVRYLLLVDEASLDHPAAERSDYADWYQSRRPTTTEGHSVFDLELGSRLFRHRISPLVQSRMVQNFPPTLKKSLFQRLNNVLTGHEPIQGFSISPADRQATLAVVRASVPDWPQE